MTAETAIAVKAPEALALRPAHSLDALAENFREAAKHGHLLSPIIAVDQIPAFHQVSMRAVVVDPTIPAKGDSAMGTGPECYRDPRFCDIDEVALGKNALMKIMSAAGIQVVEAVRLDDRKDPHYCNIQVRLAWIDMDGLAQQRTASKEIDLRSGSPGTMQPEKDKQGKKTGKMVPMQETAIADKRKNIAALCETEAILRGVRSILALSQKYKVADLAKPFFVPKLVPFLDVTDPDQKAVALGRLGAAQSNLYGAPAAALPAPINVTPALEAREWVDGDGVIHEAPEPKAVTVPQEPCPWDIPAETPAHRKLSLDKADIARAPEEFRPWWVRIAEYIQAIYDRLGPEIGRDCLEGVIPQNMDPATMDRTAVVKLGAALKALV